MIKVLLLKQGYMYYYINFNLQVIKLPNERKGLIWINS